MLKVINKISINCDTLGITISGLNESNELTVINPSLKQYLTGLFESRLISHEEVIFLLDSQSIAPFDVILNEYYDHVPMFKSLIHCVVDISETNVSYVIMNNEYILTYDNSLDILIFERGLKYLIIEQLLLKISKAL